MIFLGLIVVEIIAVVGDYPKSLKLFNTILIVKITGNLMKGRLCLVALQLSFTTRIICSISGDVLVSTFQVNHHSTRNFCNWFLHWRKLTIRMNCCDFETTFLIEDIDAPKRF